MRAIHFLLVLLMALLVVAISCSKSGSPVAPVEMTDMAQSSWSNRYVLSFNLFRIEPSTGKLEIIPARDTAVHFNVLKFLEIWPCTDCVRVISISDSDHGTKLIGLALENPFPSPNQTVFDVRGIAMFYGSRNFPVIDKTVPDASLGDGELVNADGYTSLYHFGTQFYDTSGYQSYYKGKMATTAAPEALLQGFKRFWSTDPANTRNAFYVGDTITRTFDIDMPDPPFIFGYAVDANWATPTVKPVTDPMTQFPPEANSPEPWKVQAGDEPVGYGLTDEGGQTTLYIDVFDYQGKDSHSDPVLECPELFDGAKTATYEYPGIGFNTWSIVVENEKLAPAGKYKCLISVVDDANASAPEWLDLTAYQVYTFDVIEHPHGWARTWGGNDFDCGYDVAADADGNMYVTGVFLSDTVDFDPGSGTDLHTSGGTFDVFLSKFDTKGDFLWAQTWGGAFAEFGSGIAADIHGNAYVTGSFYDTIDFDPGPGTDIHSATTWDKPDAFLVKYDASGSFQWAQTWGGQKNDLGKSVAVNEPNAVYVVGSFDESADFDPGPDVDIHTTSNRASFLSKFDTDGNWQWARTWGEGYYDIANGVAIDTLNNIYVAGDFTGAADFDPGPGEDIKSGSFAAYLTKYNPSGDYQWAAIWESDYNSWTFGRDTAVDLDGGVWVTGSFEGTCDFDPGPGTVNHSAYGVSDAYLTKFDPSGEFMSVAVWEGTYADSGESVATAGLHQVYMTGWESVYPDIVQSHIFLTKWTDTTLDWARAWGGEMDIPSSAVAVASDLDGNAFVTGTFVLPIDFDPGPDEDIHTPDNDDAFLTKLLPDGNW